MFVLLKIGNLWLSSEDAYPAAKAEAAEEVSIIKLPDAAVIISASERFPVTKDGFLEAFLEWSKGDIVWDPERKEFLIYEALDFDKTLGTWGGAWRIAPDPVATTVTEDFIKELVSGKWALLNEQYHVLWDERPLVRPLVERIERFLAKADIPERRFREFMKKHGQEKIRGNDVERNGKLVNFKNGVYDLATMTFRSSRREDFIFGNLNVTYNPSADVPEMWPFLDSVFSGDLERTEFTLGLLGTMLDRTLTPRPLTLFYAPHGCMISSAIQFVRFLGRCFNPFMKISPDALAETGKIYFNGSRKFRIDGEIFPWIKFLGQLPFKLNDKDIRDIEQAGSGQPITCGDYASRSFPGNGTLMTVLLVNELPKLDIESRLYVIQFDTYNSTNGMAVLNDALYQMEAKSMFMNLLIEYYHRWVNGEIQETSESYFYVKDCRT